LKRVNHTLPFSDAFFKYITLNVYIHLTFFIPSLNPEFCGENAIVFLLKSEGFVFHSFAGLDFLENSDILLTYYIIVLIFIEV